MTVKDLKVKVQKAEEAVQKAQKTIERHTTQMEKKLKVVLDHGWDPEDRYCKHGTAEHNEAYWAICEYADKVQDIKNATKKLEDKIRILNNWKERLVAAEAKEHKFLTEVPECMKVMMQELITQWDVYDMGRRAQLKESYRNKKSYDDWMKHHSYADYQFMYMTDEQIHNENVRDAEASVMDLYNRVNAITGEVTDWEYLHWGGKAINGEVHGKLGSVRVESILAGGYNIQRLHIRVLVHEIKK